MKKLILAVTFACITAVMATGVGSALAWWLGLCFGYYLLEGMAIVLWEVVRCETDMDRAVREARRNRRHTEQDWSGFCRENNRRAARRQAPLLHLEDFQA